MKTSPYYQRRPAVWLSKLVCAMSIACGAPDTDAPPRVALPPAEGARLVVEDRLHVPLIGQLGDPIESINHVTAAADRVVVLEGETNSLLVLSRRGRVLFSTLNTGAGGAMLAHPIQMTWMNASALVVADGDVPQLAQFELRDDSLLLSSVLPLRDIASVKGVCGVGGATFVLGKSSSEDNRLLVHRVGVDGDTKQSFGADFGPADAMNDIFYRRNQRLLCLPRQGLMLVASRYYHAVHALEAEGTLRWEQDIPGFRPVTYVETEPGRFIYNYPDDDVWDEVVSLFHVTEAITAVQVRRWRGRDARGPSEGIYTVLLEMSTGRPVGVQTDLPMVASAGAGRLFAVDASGALSFLRYVVREH